MPLTALSDEHEQNQQTTKSKITGPATPTKYYVQDAFTQAVRIFSAYFKADIIYQVYEITHVNCRCQVNHTHIRSRSEGVIEVWSNYLHRHAARDVLQRLALVSLAGGSARQPRRILGNVEGPTKPVNDPPRRAPHPPPPAATEVKVTPRTHHYILGWTRGHHGCSRLPAGPVWSGLSCCPREVPLVSGAPVLGPASSLHLLEATRNGVHPEFTRTLEMDEKNGEKKHSGWQVLKKKKRGKKKAKIMGRVFFTLNRFVLIYLHILSSSY